MDLEKPGERLMDVGQFYQAVNNLASNGGLNGYSDSAVRKAVSLGHAGAIRHLEEADVHVSYERKFEALKGSIRQRGPSFSDNKTSTGCLYRELFWSETDERLLEYIGEKKLEDLLAQEILESDGLDEADSRLDFLKDRLLGRVLETEKKWGQDTKDLDEVAYGRVKEVQEDLEKLLEKIYSSLSERCYDLGDLIGFDRLDTRFEILGGDRVIGLFAGEEERSNALIKTRYLAAVELGTRMAECHSRLDADYLSGQASLGQWNTIVNLTGKYLKKAENKGLAGEIVERLEKAEKIISGKLALSRV